MPRWSGRADLHPDLETLSAFVDGGLLPRKQTDIETHLASCEDCFDLVSELMEAVVASSDATVLQRGGEPVPAAKVTPFYRRRGTIWVVSALATAAALVLMVRLNIGSSSIGSTDANINALIDAVQGERPIEGRLSGGFRYAPVRPTLRSKEAPPLDNVPLLRAAGEIQKRATEDPTPQNLHALGVAQLLTGRSTEAINTLELARRQGETARLLSDLAAAYLARSSLGGTSADSENALEHSERAMALDPDSRDAQFNRALALEARGLNAEAAKAFEEFIATETDARWKAEAEDRRKRLQVQPVPPR